MALLPTPANTGKITDQLSIIRDKHTSLYIYSKGDNTIAIDTGFGGSNLDQELKKLQIDPAKVTNIFLTHSDRDHVGGINTFKNAQIHLSKKEIPLLSGQKKRFLILQNKITTEKEYTTLKDQETIWAGHIKITAIETPGHTPGSMSYLIDDKILCTGDTLTLKNGKAQPTIWLLNMDNNTLKKSLKKIAQIKGLDIICTSHSGYTKNPKNAMDQWQ
jgi:hydroxyacylglutathione hydrolase